MEITNPNYNTMPEQVNQNTKDIAVLKNTVKTPATIYNATVEMAQDAGVINQSNIAQQVTNTANAFVLDTVGKLFRIVTVENDQVYVAYCASIRGPQGTNGENGVGIQSITSIAPTQDNGYTVTPVTFTDTDENQTTLNIRAKNGDYTPITEYTYATLVNVVSGSCRYFKMGNCVVVIMQETQFSGQFSANQIAYSNLPKANGSVIVNALGNNDPGRHALRLSIRDNSRDLIVWFETYTPDPDERYYVTFSYLTNE